MMSDTGLEDIANVRTIGDFIVYMKGNSKFAGFAESLEKALPPGFFQREIPEKYRQRLIETQKELAWIESVQRNS